MRLIKKHIFEILVFLLFVGIRLPQLGHDTFNTDVWKWKSRSYDFGSGVYNLDFIKTLQRYHPGVTLMWIGSTAVKVNNVVAEMRNLQVTEQIFLLHFIQKLFIVLVLGFCYALIFGNLSAILGNRLAMMSTVILMFEPFNLALTREIHLEGLLSTFMLLSVLYMYRSMVSADNFDSKYFNYSAIFAGLAILTKTTALFLLPYALLVFFYYIKKNFRSKISLTIKWGLLVLLVFIAMWPAIWVAPLEVFNSLYKGIFVVGVDTDHEQFYFGKLVADPGYFYYLIVLLLRSSPVLIFGLLIGLISFKKLNWERARFAVYLGVYSLLYLIFVSIPSKKLDRYLLPSILSYSIISSIYIQYFFDTYLIKLRNNLKLVLSFIPLLITYFYLNFDYMSYYNPMFGGLKVGMNILEPKWMIGKNNIINYFSEVKRNDEDIFAGDNISFEKVVYSSPTDEVLAVGFQEKYYTQIWPFFREIGSFAIIQDLTPFAQRTDYFVYPVWDDSGTQENRFPIKKIDTIKIRGVDVYNVYKRI